MVQQNNSQFPYNPMLQGSPRDFFSGQASYQAHQSQPGGSDMHRDPSSQSTNTNNSDWTQATASSFTTLDSQPWDIIYKTDLLPKLEIEETNNMRYDNTTSMAYGGNEHFSGGAQNLSPMTEILNKFDGSLESYQSGSGSISPDTQQSNPLSMIPRYPHIFNEPSLSPERSNGYNNMNDYRTHATQPMSRSSTHGSSSNGYQQPYYLPSNSQNGYTHEQYEEHTPTSLGWETPTNLVEKYKLIMTSKPYYLQIIQDSDITPLTPAIVYLDSPSSTTSPKGTTPCFWPGPCKRKEEPFTRAADCGRHMLNVHGPPEFRKKFLCPHDPCLNNRHLEENAFTRKDHCRDHLRDYHQEDVGMCKGEKSARTKEEKEKYAKDKAKWLADRKISASHWRCAKCLVKISVARQGWVCVLCNTRCEEERIEARVRLGARADDGDVEMGGREEYLSHPTQQLQRYQTHQHLFGYMQQQQTEKCQTCLGVSWVDNGYAEWNPCPSCNFREEEVDGNCFAR